MTTAILLAAALCAAAEPLPGALQSKRYGVLLLGEGGGSSWSATVDAAKKALGKDVPLEFAPGEADAAILQHGIDSLQSQGVRLIVAVPLFLDSQSPVMDQTRYLLGIRESPSRAFLDAPHSIAGAPSQRLDIRTPLVLAKALDDNALLVDVIAARAKALSPHPGADTLVLIGTPSSKDDALHWAGLMSSLAQAAGRSAGFRSAKALALESQADQDTRERSERMIGETLRQLRAAGGVVVVPTELSAGAERLALGELLDGMFVRYDAKDLLPDPKLVQWVARAARQASNLPDMRLFRKDARRLAAPPPLTFEHKLDTSPQGATR